MSPPPAPPAPPPHSPPPFVSILHDHVLLEIFDHLVRTPPHIFACSLVSKHWHSLVTPLLWRRPRFKHWDLVVQTPIFAKYGRWVRDIALLHDSCDDFDVQLVVNTCPEVRELDFSGTGVTIDSVRMISEITGMTERLEGLFLNSIQNGLDGECLVHVARLSNLRRLGIAEMSDLEDDAVMQVLERCPLLEAVNFSETDITDEILRVMSERLSSTLRTAVLNRCKNITDVGVRLLVERCRNLQRLGLNWCQLTDKTLQVLGQVAGPKLLSISVARCAMMTPTGFSALFHGCTDLELVDAESSNVDLQALTMLGAYVKNIKHLALSECHLLTDSTLFQLMTSRAVEKLQYLDISLCMHISDRAFGSIGAWRCPALQYLNLSCLEVTDTTLDALLHVTSLVSLDLVSCQFSKPAMMRFFANKPALCRAHLSDIDCLDDELFEWIVDRCKQLWWCSVVGTSVTEECAKRKMEKRDWLVVDYELIDEQVHCAM